MSEYQEEVLTNILDLQAELRGDEPEPHDEQPVEASDEGSPEVVVADGQETVAVTEEGVTVSVPSGSTSSVSVPSGPVISGPSTKGLGVNERLAALNERLAQLEYELVGVTKRIERMEPDPEDVSAGSSDADVDARWRSFLDLQKIVADRLEKR
jgi:hypothetical protein